MIKQRRQLGGLAIAAAIILMAGPSGSQISHFKTAEPVGETQAGLAKLDTSTFDASAEPCTDFYQHVCGAWTAQASKSLDRDAIYRNADIAEARANAGLDRILTDPKIASDPEVGRLQRFYASCLSADPTAEATLSSWLKRIDQSPTRAELVNVITALQARGVHPFFQFSGEPDPDHATRFRGQVDQAALRLRKERYADTDPNGRKLLASYRDHVQRMMVLSGESAVTADRDASAILALETVLAAKLLTRNEEFDAKVSNNPTMQTALARDYPHLDWPGFLTAAGQPASQALNVTSPAYLRVVDDLLAKTPMDDLKAFVRWRLIDSLATAGPTAMRTEDARFTADVLNQPADRTAVCRLETIKAMGVEYSRQFSIRFLPSQARAGAQEVIERVRTEINRSVDEADWLSPNARTEAKRKIAGLSLKIGYPRDWPPTGRFQFRQDDFLGNLLMARAFNERRAWSRVTRPRSRGSWEIMVYPNAAPGLAYARLTIPNGFPDAFTNSIIFTAAFLTPPIYDPEAPLDVQLGSLGAVAGHEMTHVIETHDFDSEGHAREIWSDADIKAHDHQSECLIDEAERFEPDRGHVNGKQTFDENVADQNGIVAAYRALVRAFGGRINERDADGNSRAQRFFMAYAQNNCGVERPEFQKIDGHASPRFRVNGLLANMPEFAAAFSCKAGAPMAHASAGSLCSVW